ncbi:MAG: ScyD/ScyE family protein [Gaiellaceae bacterium]
MAKAHLILGALIALVIALVAVSPASARPDPDGVVVEGLSDPRGIAAAGGRTLLVAEEGSGKITRIDPRRGGKKVAVSTFAQFDVNPEAGPFPVEVAYQSLRHVWVTLAGDPAAGGGRVVRLDRKGNETVSVDIAGYQQTDPDPNDQEDFPEESNPFGLAILPGGGVLLADSANNDLLRINPKRQITTVARFLPEDVPWPDGLPFPGPPPGTPVPAEAVPTAVAIGADGAWYVSELKGFPFTKGASRIWRIEPGAENATCDPANPNTGPCTTYATGFTSVIDLAFGRDGTMYVLEIVKEGLLGAEVFGDPPIGALWAVDGGTKTELAPGSLMAPGGVAVGHNGSLSVTTGTVFGPGGGVVVRVNP